MHRPHSDKRENPQTLTRHPHNECMYSCCSCACFSVVRTATLYIIHMYMYTCTSDSCQEHTVQGGRGFGLLAWGCAVWCADSARVSRVWLVSSHCHNPLGEGLVTLMSHAHLQQGKQISHYTVRLVTFEDWNFHGLKVTGLIFFIFKGSNYHKDHWLLNFLWTVTDCEKYEIKNVWLYIHCVHSVQNKEHEPPGLESSQHMCKTFELYSAHSNSWSKSLGTSTFLEELASAAVSRVTEGPGTVEESSLGFFLGGISSEEHFLLGWVPVSSEEDFLLCWFPASRDER